MNRKKVAALSLATAILLGLFGIFAAEEEYETLTLSFNEAIEIAKENSETLLVSDLDVEKSEVNLREAQSGKKDLEDYEPSFYSGLDAQVAARLVENGYYVRVAEMGLTLSEKGREMSEELLEFSVTEAYFDYLLGKQDYDLKNLNQERSKKQYNIVRTKFDLGTATRQEVLNAEAAYEQAVLAFENANSDWYYKRLKLNQVLGLSSETRLELTDGFDQAVMSDVDLDEKTAMALENRFSVISKKETYETAKLYYEILSKLYTTNTYRNRQAFYDMEKAYNNLINAEADAVLSVNKAYVDMVKANRSIQAVGKSREALAEAYRLTLLSYELGMSTLVDVMGAESALAEIEYNELQTIHGYNMAKLNFELSYGIGITQ